MLDRQRSHAKAQGCARASLLHWNKYDTWVVLAQMWFLGDWEELSPSGIPRWSHQHARTALAPARSLAEWSQGPAHAVLLSSRLPARPRPAMHHSTIFGMPSLRLQQRDNTWMRSSMHQSLIHSKDSASAHGCAVPAVAEICRSHVARCKRL